MNEAIKKAESITQAEEIKVMNEFLKVYRKLMYIKSFIEGLNTEALILLRSCIDYEIKLREAIDR